MKPRNVKVAGAIAFLIIYISVSLSSVYAAEVWSDNFNDEDISDWTVLAWDEGSSITGNFSAEGGVLTALDNDLNLARHDSTTNVGTWSFDMYVPDLPNAIVAINFMSNGSRPLYYYNSMMVSVQAMTEGTDRFIIWEIRGWEAIEFEAPYFPTEGVVGWHHIDITRSSTGNFKVFFNGTLE